MSTYVSGFAPTVVDRSGSITAGGTSQQVMAKNTARRYLVFQNVSDTAMYVNFGGAALVDTDSVKINAGGSLTFSDEWVPADAVHVICATTGKKFVAKEGI